MNRLYNVKLELGKIAIRIEKNIKESGTNKPPSSDDNRLSLREEALPELDECLLRLEQ